MGQGNGKNDDEPGTVAPVYVNHCNVVASLSDATLTFAQAGDGQEQPRVKARLVTSPTHLERFSDAIADACRQHKEQFVKGGPDSDAEDAS